MIRFDILGYALAMRVLQSPLYLKLDEKERAECDELIRQGLRAGAKIQNPNIRRPCSFCGSDI